MVKYNIYRFRVYALFISSLFILAGCSGKEKSEHYLQFKKLSHVQEYFAYKGDKSILFSGHRGGREAGFPENSIEGFEQVLRQMPAFFEVDPRLTKDSVIVLMHDATLDRTTDATGNLSDYTWSELQSVRLKDHAGNITSAKIPTLEEVLKWSKGKTIVNLDKKDVPMEMIVELIKELKAEKQVMLTVHTGAQARYYADRLPGVMLSVFARNNAEFDDIVISGAPWENMIAYVGQGINDSNRAIVEYLRARGVRCMVAYAPSLDRLRSAEERADAYRKAQGESADVIESDYPVEVWNALIGDR